MAWPKNSPAKGAGIDYGPAKGAGWGGPANPGHGDKRPFNAASADGRGFQPGNKGNTMDDRAVYASRAARRRERAAAMEDILNEIASNREERTDCRIAAATRLHAICDGMPVQTNINMSIDDVDNLSTAEIRDELARYGAKAAEAAARGLSAPVSDGPGDVVH